MSRRACKTCAWWVAGKYEYGICAYTTRHVHHTHWLIDVRRAPERIRLNDDTCEHWECDEEDEHE